MKKVILVFLMVVVIVLTGCLNQISSPNQDSDLPVAEPGSVDDQSQSDSPQSEEQPQNVNQNEELIKDMGISAEAKDTITGGPLHGKIGILIPAESLGIWSFEAVAMPYSKYQEFVGGGYRLLPAGIELTKPAEVRIMYTETALNLYKQNNADFKDNLSLAYYDNNQGKYIPIESTYNKSTRTVTGYISKFYDGVITIIDMK